MIAANSRHQEEEKNDRSQPPTPRGREKWSQPTPDTKRKRKMIAANSRHQEEEKNDRSQLPTPRGREKWSQPTPDTKRKRKMIAANSRHQEEEKNDRSQPPTPRGREKWSQPTPDTKKKRKITKLTCTKQTNKCMRSTQTSSLFPKRGDHNTKRNDETRGQRAREDFKTRSAPLY